MASKTFTPSIAVNVSKEKDWAANLGMLDWDSTRIVFTKRRFIEFLKYAGVTVDTNYSNISKLPRYAEFMDVTADNQDGPKVEDDSVNQITEAVASSFKPSRRVRTAPGGVTSDIFGLEGTEDDALSHAPTLQQSSSKDQITAKKDAEASQTRAVAADEQPVSNNIRPSRRVRTAPGGKDSLSEMWGSMNNDAEEAVFKPTRRVRQTPGGQDNLAGIL